MRTLLDYLSAECDTAMMCAACYSQMSAAAAELAQVSPLSHC